MKRKLAKQALCMTLVAASIFSLAACGKEAETAAETTAPTQAAVAVPQREEPDRANLLYLSAIEPYCKADWTANWIWTKSCSDDSYVVFRKTVTADADMEATAYISAVDKYVLWLNGELVVLDGSLKRGPTPYDSYYDEIKLNLKEGENTIAMLVAFNGRSGDGSIVPVAQDEEGDDYNQAGMIFQMQVGNTLVVSDSSWKAQRHPGYKNRVTAGKDYPNYTQMSMLAERNLYFDARDDIGAFMNPGFDDSAWENATPVGVAGQLPFGALYEAIIDPIRFYEISEFSNAGDYVGKELTEDTTLELVLPGNIQFTPYFELEAPAGKRLTIYTDSYVDSDNNPNFKDTYVTAEGTQQFENYAWRSGTKLYIEAEAGVKFTSLGYRRSEFNGNWAGSFHSDDEKLDQLWQESLNTVAICMRDTYMDCPERERGPYMGDASNQIDAALYGYDQGGLAMTKKAILSCLGWTPESGAIPSRAPSVKPQEIPNQSLAFMTSAYHYWLASGDRQTMTDYYHAFVNYLKLYEMENGLPVYRAGSWTWNDWGNKIDANLLQVGFYYYALNLTEKLAGDLGITEDEAFLTERMESIKAHYHDAYYTPAGFKDPDSKYVDDRANAMLALSGLADESDYDLICDVVMSTYEASPFCEKYVLEALCVMDRTDLAVQRMMDRYNGMLEDEYDTLWEKFTEPIGTFNHGWSAAPMYILSKYVAGIQPTSGGYETYCIAPSTVLERFSCAAYTPKGVITVEKNGDSLTITAVSGGTLVLPSGEKILLEEGTHTYSMA